MHDEPKGESTRSGDDRSALTFLSSSVRLGYLKGASMRLRLLRVAYLVATVTAFVFAAGAGRKFGG
jgi:hypothetical protein